MHKTAFIIIIFVVLLSCSTNEASSVSDKSNSIHQSTEVDGKFLKLYDKLPELKLPYRIICGIEPSKKKGGVEYSPIPGFISMAKIAQNDNSEYKMILGYYQSEIRYPYLFSFTSSGQKIDSVAIHNGNCDSDPWIAENCWSEIRSPNKVIMIDTTRYYFFNDTIRSLDSTVVLMEEVSISRSGKFRIIKL